MNDPTEAYVDAAAAVLGLPIPADQRAAVLGYFRLAAGMAAQVMAVPLSADDESGSVFVPVAPRSAEEPT